MTKRTLSARDTFRKATDLGSLGLHIKESDTFRSIISGTIFWELRDGKTGELQDSGSWPNIVTLDASILVARLMKSTSTPNVSEPRFGCYALAVGTGDVGWDLQNPPVATVTQRSLYNEIARKQMQISEYVDAEGSISGIPTNIVDFTTTYSEAEAVGPIVEMGILGGDIDTNMANRNPILPPNGIYDPTVDVTGKDMLGNYKTFKVLNKPATSTLSFTWRLTF
jgi:hypothetical protein